jgi:hypothetical protein
MADNEKPLQDYAKEVVRLSLEQVLKSLEEALRDEQEEGALVPSR